MFAPAACDFLARAYGGTTVTPGANDAMGSYAALFGAAIPFDVYGVMITIRGVQVSGQAKPYLADIGADPAGGTAYGVIIPKLNGCCAPLINTTGVLAGFYYYFPLFIKAGTTLAARAQVGNATAGTSAVVCNVFGKPKRPERHRVGAYVDAIGIDAANSRGTTLTPGTPSLGTAVSLGTLPRSAWWAIQSHAVDDDTMTLQFLTQQLSIGGTDLIAQQSFGSSSLESINPQELNYPDCFREMAAGTELFAAGIASIGADANHSGMAYVLGG